MREASLAIFPALRHISGGIGCMTRIMTMNGVYCVFLLVFVSLFATVDRASAWEGVVVKVLDGDSLRIRRSGKIEEIRLYGIDAPEYRQPYSNKAKQYVRRMVNGREVAVEEMDIDRYGRIVALVTLKDRLVNRELVEAGLAWYYPRYCRRQPLCGELAELEARARRQGRGLWRDPDPVPPWEWKRRVNRPLR
jgi:micrococcal nuclease